MNSNSFKGNLFERVAVCVPTYFGSQLLPTTFQSLLSQTFQDFKVYVRDDTPPNFVEERDATRQYIEQLNDSRFSYIANEENLGYPRNLMSLIDDAEEDLVFLLAQDDILSPIAIESCVRALYECPKVAAVARPYYWYFEDLNKPVRQIPSLGNRRYQVIDANSPINEILLVLLAVSQLTGLMYRKSLLSVPFVNSVFPAHIYPFAGALRDHGVIYLPFNTVAVSIQDSQTRKVSSIYEESPAKAWVTLYESVFKDSKYSRIRNAGIKNHMGKNYVGLVQIRSYGKYRYFLRECIYMLKIRRLNILSLRFWVSCLSLAILPRRVIQAAVDNFKSHVLARKLVNVRLAEMDDKWW